MSFTTGRVIKVYGGWVSIENNYGDTFLVREHEVDVDDLSTLQVGLQLVIHESGTIELASSSFLRWREELEVEELALSLDITKVGWDE